jgi:hypothetical protein
LQGLEHSFLGFDVPTKTATLWDDGKTAFNTVNVNSIGLALVNLFTDTAALEKAKNEYVYISSVKTTQLEIFAALKEVTGEEWTVKKISSKKVLVNSRERVRSGDLSSLPTILQGIQFGEDGLANFGTKTEKWNRLLRLDEEESVEETVRRVAKTLKA